MQFLRKYFKNLHLKKYKLQQLELIRKVFLEKNEFFLKKVPFCFVFHNFMLNSNIIRQEFTIKSSPLSE
jgi:hypothetical protein